MYRKKQNRLIRLSFKRAANNMLRHTGLQVALWNTDSTIHTNIYCQVILNHQRYLNAFQSFTVSTKLTSKQKHISVYWPEPTAEDDSGMPPSRNRTHIPGAFLPVGVSTITYTFTDIAKNKAVCSFNITVVAGKITQLYFHFT